VNVFGNGLNFFENRGIKFIAQIVYVSVYFARQIVQHNRYNGVIGREAEERENPVRVIICDFGVFVFLQLLYRDIGYLQCRFFIIFVLNILYRVQVFLYGNHAVEDIVSGLRANSEKCAFVH
jgi:hypothetical protein